MGILSLFWIHCYEHFRLYQICSDIHGLLSPTSYSGQRFMIHFTCATSRYTFLYFMETGDQAADRFPQFLTGVSQLGHTVAAVVLRTDGDSVYTGGDLVNICESQGIRQEISAPCGYSQNTSGCVPVHASRFDPVVGRIGSLRSRVRLQTDSPEIIQKSVIEIGNSSKKLKIKSSIGSPSDRGLSKPPFKVVAKSLPFNL